MEGENSKVMAQWLYFSLGVCKLTYPSIKNTAGVLPKPGLFFSHSATVLVLMKASGAVMFCAMQMRVLGAQFWSRSVRMLSLR